MMLTLLGQTNNIRMRLMLKQTQKGGRETYQVDRKHPKQKHQRR